jgi:capsular polysaccharide biosynthesis protein
LVITDEFSNGYFHWVADGLPKLALLGDDLRGRTLVLPSFASRFRYMAESLAPWPELRTVTLATRTLTRLSDATLVPALAPTGNYRPESIQLLGDRWRAHVGVSSPHRRVYVSRASAPWRKIANENEILPLMRQAGFEVVQLEGLSFANQVRLLAETKVLISNHGAGLTNMLFMQPGGHVVEIRRSGDAENNCYFDWPRRPISRTSTCWHRPSMPRKTRMWATFGLTRSASPSCWGPSLD